MTAGSRVMVRGGADMAGTVLVAGAELSRVLWDNGEVWCCWTCALERV
jgi:hypothetical protein